MPRLDLIHDIVKNALIKDGWTITADPYTIKYGGLKVQIDLAAERPFAAERNGEQIVVEVKSFFGLSLVRDLEMAVGQYTLYLGFLEVIAPEKKLYLAVSHEVYANFFALEAVQFTIQRNKMSLIVVDIEREEIVKWIS